jgi:serine-type D-Ala-D-Ala carboxypeptidase/endopeptidase (penicillin-binding protein 4)
MSLIRHLVIFAMLFCLTATSLANQQLEKRPQASRSIAAKKNKVKPKVTRKKKRRVNPARVKAKKIQLPSVIYGTNQLSQQISQIIESDSGNAEVAVYIKSMSNGSTLYARKISTLFTPASTLKIFTAEAALLYLGPEYRFSTQVLTDASGVSNGMLKGNLYVVLSGDPSLTYEELLELMMSLKNEGIRSIEGNVYIDNSAYDQRIYGPGWEGEDKAYCYAAPISASIINHNCLPFQVSAAGSGQKAKIVKSPKYFYPEIKNSVVTRRRSSGCSVRLTKEPGSPLSVDGCLPKGRSWGMSYVVTDLPEYNRALFKSILSQLSIKVYGKVTFAIAPDNLEYIGTHSSKPLNLLVKDMLKKSDNIIAGALFKKLGQLHSRQPGSWENGSVAVSKILSRQAGVSVSGMRILDGSGLSADNLATPAQMMKVLDFAYHHPATSYDFIPPCLSLAWMARLKIAYMLLLAKFELKPALSRVLPAWQVM